MRVLATGSTGIVGDGTILRLNQAGNIVWASIAAVTARRIEAPKDRLRPGHLFYQSELGAWQQ
jgi:hypothetical protein